MVGLLQHRFPLPVFKLRNQLIYFFNILNRDVTVNFIDKKNLDLPVTPSACCWLNSRVCCFLFRGRWRGAHTLVGGGTGLGRKLPGFVLSRRIVWVGCARVFFLILVFKFSCVGFLIIEWVIDFAMKITGRAVLLAFYLLFDQMNFFFCGDHPMKHFSFYSHQQPDSWYSFQQIVIVASQAVD